MTRPWSLLLKLQRFYKQNIDCSHVSYTISSCVAVSYFLWWLGQSEASKGRGIKAPILRKMKNQLVKQQQLEKNIRVLL